MYRLAVPESRTKNRLVWFVSVEHMLHSDGLEPAGPLTSLEAVYEHLKDLYYEEFDLLADFPEKDEIERFNKNTHDTKATISEEFLKSLEVKEAGSGEPG